MNNLAEISACLIVKNEEEHIERCITSLKSAVQEIVVVDTGSTDNTINILKRLDIQVYHYVWDNDFSKARNFSISFATKPYILIMDADEILERDSVKKIIEYTANKRNKKLPATVIIENYINADRCVKNRLTRMFPNNQSFYFEGFIHEQLYSHGEPVAKKLDTDVRIGHNGYKEDEINNKNKLARNLSLLKKQLVKEPNSPYINFQIGQTHYVGKEYEKAECYFDEALKLLSKYQNLPGYASSIFLSYGYCLFYKGKFQELDHLLNDALDFYSDYTDLYFYTVSL
ncbi:glycosyltransferase [Paenibacillus sp. RC84]|uniref:glycosyltransferase n=1 Tax=Paenibacillus sp. RC84 TaxID=3156252 RepID=UPI003518D58E